MLLSTAMREGSMAEHTAAEGSTFLTELLDGRLTAAAYAAYLGRLRMVYAALEESVRAHAHNPLVAAVHDPALERLARIDADLDHWSPGAAEVDSPAARAYRDRVRTAGDAWGGHLVAHHYTRYLGDLSGGRAIGRILERTFALGDRGDGVAFYSFAGIPRPKPYKDGYRSRLDGLGLDPDDVARVVAEVQVAFRLNQDLFTELGLSIDAYRR